MAGRARQRALARALDIHVVGVRDLQHRQAERRVHLAARAIALDESHPGHQVVAFVQASATAGMGSPACAAANAAAAKSISAAEVKRPIPMRKLRAASSGGKPSALNT